MRDMPPEPNDDDDHVARKRAREFVMSMASSTRRMVMLLYLLATVMIACAAFVSYETHTWSALVGLFICGGVFIVIAESMAHHQRKQVLFYTTHYDLDLSNAPRPLFHRSRERLVPIQSETPGTDLRAGSGVLEDSATGHVLVRHREAMRSALWMPAGFVALNAFLSAIAIIETGDWTAGIPYGIGALFCLLFLGLLVRGIRVTARDI
jgi:hypothetical protein